MALKNLFEMVKADKYTADGREALIKAQEAETEDKVYNIGEISEKTGLQKTAQGWKPPKETKFGKVKQNKEGQWGVQTKQGKGSDFLKHKSEKEASRALANYTAGYNTTERSKQDPHSDEARQQKQWNKETDKIRKASNAERRAEHASHFQNEPQKLSAAEQNARSNKGITANEIKTGNQYQNENGAKINITGTGTDGSIQFMVTTSEGTKQAHHARSKEEMERILSVNGYAAESKPAASSGIPDFHGMESGDYDKKLRAEGWTTGGWEGSGTHASAIFKKGDRTIRVNEGQPGKITSVQEISKPSESKPDGADRHDEIGGEIKGNLETAKYYFDKAQSFSLTDPSFKTYMAKAKEYNDKAKAQADDYGFDWEEMHNRGITNAVNEFAKQNKNNKSTEAYSWFKREAGDSAPRVLTGDTRIRVRKA